MNVSIIGAGLGGLSTGIHLLNKGYRVKIFEKGNRPGGRANLIEEKGYKIDTAPTLILMPEVLEDLFRIAGRDIRDYLTLKRLTPAYELKFADGRVFRMTDDLKDMVRQIKEFKPNGEEPFFDYVKDVQDKFVSSKNTFITRNFESVLDIVNLRSVLSFLKVKPFGRAYQHAHWYFKNDHLAAAFSTQCLYLGQSPFKTPSLYNLLSYIEFSYGVWYPEGGIHKIPEALVRLFKEMGGELHLNSEVKSIVVEKGSACGIKLMNDTVELSDVVVSNRDLPASYYNFVDEKFRPRMSNQKILNLNYGCSAVMFYLGVRKKVEGLKHHTILLSRDYKKSLREIFDEKILPNEPLLYVCSPTKTDNTLAPPGKDIVYILALCPNTSSGVDWKKDVDGFRRRVFKRMHEAGVDINQEDLEVSKTFTPENFEKTFGNFYGNGFGIAPDFFQSACFRPMTKSQDIRNLYHVGLSTHPGGGVPMVLMCGKLVADQIAKHKVRKVK